MSFNEEKNFTREELVHALRSCATMGAECEQCEFYEADTPRGYNPCHESLLLTKAANFIESIPSAEPEQKRTFSGIDVSYPTICTYPEYEGKPYYAIKYLEDGEIIVGFGTYKPDVLSEYLRKYFIPSAR